MTFGPDGCLYVLEYGMGESESKGSRLTKVIYQTRNRNPIAVALANRLSGAAPLRINFSAGESYDKDSGDYLKYKWFFPGGKSDKKTPAFTFNKPGTYTVTLQVTDKHGASSKASLKIQVGNTAPEVKLSHTGKDDFLNKKLCYNVAVTDKEDAASGGINRKNIRTQIYYLKPGEILTPYGTVMPEKAMKGRQLITTNDCGSCHSMGLASQIGPGFLRVSKKYTADLKTERSLALKIIQGGKGVWGITPCHRMTAFLLMMLKPLFHTYLI
jgi:cytochrome c